MLLFVHGLPLWASAVITCRAFNRNDDGQWVAKQDTTLPDMSSAVRTGQVARRSVRPLAHSPEKRLRQLALDGPDLLGAGRAFFILNVRLIPRKTPA
jgi:hypothetical protein